ncbi:hypothetical protein SEVIR_7G066400v4 [Setaria viridis]
MERGLAMAAFGAAIGRESSPSSRSSSSGCQSGWTLYLDHSNNNGARYGPCDPAAQRWMVLQQAAEHADGDDEEEEDSMASDASSGPRPRPCDEDDDEARRGFGLHRHGFVVFDQGGGSYSGTSGQRSSGSVSGCFGGGSSTWSRSSQGGVARKAPVVTATSQYREIIDDDDEDDELDDTASSSAVFSCPMPMVHAR